MTTTNRTHTRATNPPSPRQADDALSRLANAVIGKVVARDADQGQAFLKAQATHPIASAPASYQASQHSPAHCGACTWDSESEAHPNQSPA